MNRLLSALVFFLFIVLIANHAAASSDVAFPKDWKKWSSVNTPLTEIGGLPGCNADVSTLPPIYQETVATYCSAREGGPGKVAVLVNPYVLNVYEAHNGKYPDGANVILHLKDMKVLFVLGHKGGVAVYGVFTETGGDIATKNGPLATKTCVNCHTAYKAFCISGQCGRVVKKR